MCLRETGTKRVIWKENVKLDPVTWLELQREVVGRIAAHLETYISADRLAIAIGNAGHSQVVEAEVTQEGVELIC